VNRIRKLAADHRLETLAGLLALVGLLLVFSASRSSLQRGISEVFVKQAVWVAIGTAAFFWMHRVNYRAYRRYGAALYVGMLVMLIGVLAFGSGRAGRWIVIGGFRFQPSEFAKLFGILSLAGYLAEKDPRRPGVFLGALVLAGIPFFLIFEQPNLGTAIIFVLICLFMLYQQGITKRQVAGMVGLVAAASPVFWLFLEEYQRRRILVFLRPGLDPTGAGYNLMQSKISIGSGGLIGKGYLRGDMTKLGFLPESHTDFIFCRLAEEFGLVGVTALLVVYYFFLREVLAITASTRDNYARLVGTGVLAMFFCQIAINLGMTLGLLPVAGIPLPFLSYGGSSLVVSMMAVGIMVNVRNNATMLF